MQTDMPNRAKVLIVDDVEANLRVVCRRLEDSNFELHSAQSGEQALQMIEEVKPDLVLLDYMMPQMNGIEVLNIVRQEWRMTDLPIIMLTARAEAEAVVAALGAGADDYIAKPIDFDVLKARIETQLHKVKSNDDLRQANAALDERVAIRVLAFDQLREELEREIALRKSAERALEDAQVAAVNAADEKEAKQPFWRKSAAEASEAMPSTAQADTEAQTKTAREDEAAAALELIDRVIGAASAGKPINLAMLHLLRTKVAGLG